MSSLPCNSRGITLIESIIAILLLSIGLLGLLSMQPSAWRATARTDYLGRAAMMLNKELMTRELVIMNPCNHPIQGGTVTRTVYPSGQEGPQAGDVAFTVQTVTTSIAASAWRVTVTITWPPLNATGIRESIVVTPQEHFRFPNGCAS